MKIVDRLTFLALPAGVLFSKFEPASFTDLAIKGDTLTGYEGEPIDFFVQSLDPYFGGQDCGAEFETIEKIQNGEPSPPLDFDCQGRDGLFDRDQLFAVWSRDDQAALIARLQASLDARTDEEVKP